MRLNELKVEEDRLFSAYLKSKCNEETYERMKAEIEAEREEIEKSFDIFHAYFIIHKKRK